MSTTCHHPYRTIEALLGLGLVLNLFFLAFFFLLLLFFSQSALMRSYRSLADDFSLKKGASVNGADERAVNILL